VKIIHISVIMTKHVCVHHSIFATCETR